MNWYKYHIGDFDSATRHLTRVERSLYRDCLDVYYLTESPLFGNIEMLERRVCAVTEEEKKALKMVLNEFFTYENDEYRNKRADEEIAEYKDKHEKVLKAAEASAKARKKGHVLSNRTTDAEQALNGRTSNAEQTKNQEPRTKNHITKANALVGDLSPTPSKRATQLSDDWQPTEKHRELARRENKDCDRESEQFKDHHKARGNTFKDWNLAFNTWLRNNYGSNRPTIKHDHRAEKRAREFPELIEVPDL